MIRRPSMETKVSHERWLVSYSDFITLLFAFFVVMYSVSQVNENKYRILSETLGDAFSSNNQLEKPDTPSENFAQPLAELTELKKSLDKALAGIIADGQVSVYGNEQWVEIQLKSNILFQSGNAVPSEEAQRVFSDVANVLSPYDNAIAVAGHTDNIPINNKDFQNNWQLSAARAVSIVNLLAFQGVSPERMSAVGHGEYQPISDNTTEEGRAKNRRVVLRVSKEAVVLPPKALDDTVEDSDKREISTSNDTLPLEDTEENTQISQDNTQPDEEKDRLLIDQAPIKPVKLKSGGLLFSSDPQLPRNNTTDQE